MKQTCLLLVLIGFLGGALSAADLPDLVPMPKQYTALEGEFFISGVPIYVAASNRQCEIGAQDLALRVQELGGAPGVIMPADDVRRLGIYIVTIADSAGAALAQELKLTITATDPGPQGYIIEPAADRLIIIGSDNIGALYGAMTLRQMLRNSAGSGRVTVAKARIYDKPDYRFRSSMSVWRGLAYWAEGATNPLAAYQTGIDWLMRFKVNLLSDYPIAIRTDAREVDEEQRAFWRKVNTYAVERGIYPILWRWTSIGQCPADEGRPEFEGWDCAVIKMAPGDFYFCWSRDDLAREMIARNLKLFTDCGFKILALHPVDGGGIADPETWSRRCRLCRRQFGDQRWQASVHQYNLWAEMLHRAAPDAIFTVTIYPYSAAYADRRIFPNIAEEVWRKNSVDYWRNVHAGIDPQIIPQTWIAETESFTVWRGIFRDRPVFIYAHSFVPAGYFGAWHCQNGTDFTGDTRDIFYMAAGCDVYEKWLNVICSGEYAWNTQAPGAAVFDGCHYVLERDHKEPKVLFDEWVPRACRAFFGAALGACLAPVYQTGVLNRYIVEPAETLALANKKRRRPLAAVDPLNPDAAPEVKQARPDLADSASLMQTQVMATEAAWAALDKAKTHLAGLDEYRRRNFMYFYRRMPIWHMIARARYAIYRADELAASGDRTAAEQTLRDGLAWLADDRAVVEKTLAETKGEPDLTSDKNPFGKRGDIKITPDQLEKMLQQRLAALAIVLRPRQLGAQIRIGIYQGEGAEMTRAFFAQFTNAVAEIIDSLNLAVLDHYDCLLVMQNRKMDRNDFFNALPRYVREGGRGVLFQHDLCGMPRAPFGAVTPFPEIVLKAGEKVDAFKLRVVAAHPALPGLNVGDIREHMYYDHIALILGSSAQTLLEDEAGRPVVVAGEVGQGKVIFDGNVNALDNLNVQRKGRLDDYLNGILMQGAVEWFTGQKLVRR